MFAAAVIAAVSCNINTYPVFDDDDAFAGFETTSYSIAEPEEAGAYSSYEIPVTLASVAGLTASVSYSIENGTAVLGEDFELADPNMVLSFDADNRTRNIVINVLDTYVGKYTGNKNFTIKINEDGTDVELGAENTCTVTIIDSDHPLTAILHSYGMTGKETAAGPDVNWNLTIEPDASDVTIAWISNGIVAADETAGFSGVVTSSSGVPSSISFAIGQTSSENEDYVLYAVDADGTLVEEGSLIVSVSEEGGRITFKDLGPCLYDLANETVVGMILPDATGTITE